MTAIPTIFTTYLIYPIVTLLLVVFATIVAKKFSVYDVIKFLRRENVDLFNDVWIHYLSASGTSVKYTDKENHVAGSDSGAHEHVTKMVKKVEKKCIKYSIYRNKSNMLDSMSCERTQTGLNIERKHIIYPIVRKSYATDKIEMSNDEIINLEKSDLLYLK